MGFCLLLCSVRMEPGTPSNSFLLHLHFYNLFLDCLKHLNTNKMCSKNNESKQQVTLQIMECEPFLPLSEEIGSQLCLRDDSGAVVRVCTQRHTVLACIHRMFVSQPRRCSKPYSAHKDYTHDWNPLSCLLPASTHQYVGSFLCLDMEAVLTWALLKPQCTKSTMPNMCNSCKNSTPHIGHQDENE